MDFFGIEVEENWANKGFVHRESLTNLLKIKILSPEKLYWEFLKYICSAIKLPC